MEDINPGQRCLPNLRRRIRDIGDGHPAQERYMRLLKDGDTLSYQGNSEEVGCYVAGHPLSKGNCYFEVTIVDTGVRGTIAVGLVHKFYRLDHQPGWLPYSVAYHADNGKLYNGNPVGQQFGPKCARGDRIGCGIYPKTIEAGFKTVFFTKNGKEVGSVDVLVMAEGLFPAVGMHSMGEEVKVDLQAEWLLKEDDTMMMVDSHEDDWGRLTDVRVSGTLLEYIGKGKSIMDVGLAQARQPLTPRCHYYEVEIVDAGEKCYIALGLARRDYPRNRHPGWSRGSVAYHADDGKVFHGSGVGDVFGPRCFKGDIMGCGIMFPRDYILNGDADDWDQMEVFSGQADIQNIVYLNLDEEVDEEEDGDREAGQDGRKVMVFFTRNRKLVGRREMALPPGGLYPTVGMLSNGEKVKVDLHPLSG
ncbi:SPRY domain-containing protein 3 isoform X1 [Entelurus aequoreus]|uniref:SPRY domain-containing protein 3 isoform X1 n=1 Tax=Entelurus aequoreus TaxID=161455 RepID=UPI002B1E4A12|nr:SPRY domain-containing protein 3 isoform X1 [Entelurus aequoreus]XP_061909494.1 SPRY domain-containing protein 3 isoform X1 [Entelurus aequoreus]